MRRALVVLALSACGSGEPVPRRDVTDKPLADVVVAPDAAPRAGRQISVLPEAGSHPDYPTPRRAGTEELFFLEEPVRGPHVTKLAMPDRKTLRFELRAYCEIDELTVVCGREAATAKDKVSVSVGMDRGRPVLVEWKRGKRVDQTVVISYNAAGAVERMARVDATATLDWVRTYAPAGQRYTARKLGGANALDGCGAIELTTDNGRVTKRTCLQWLGDPMRDSNGVVATAYERDVDGFATVEIREGLNGRQVAGVRDLVHRIETTRDSRGRPTKLRYQAVAGHPVGSADEHGCAGLELDYERNQQRRRRCLDERGAAAPDEDGVLVVERDYDARGCAVATRYLDGQARPAARDGVHALAYDVDVHCLAVVEKCLGTGRGRVACQPGGPAEYHHDRDAHGRITRSTYVRADGTPGVEPDLEAPELRFAWDDLGREVEYACFDAAGAAIECVDMGFHRGVTTYDGNGRETTQRFFAADGSPVSNLGSFEARFLYDNYDHTSETQEYDADGALTTDDGWAIRRHYYDDSHRLYGIVLLDANGQPASYDGCFAGLECPSEPWHALALLRSASGRVLTNAYFDRDGQLLEAMDCKATPCWTE